jgi:hypothetical protein
MTAELGEVHGSAWRGVIEVGDRPTARLNALAQCLDGIGFGEAFEAGHGF